MTTTERVHVLDEKRLEWAAFRPLRSRYVSHEDMLGDVSALLGTILVAVVAHELAHHMLRFVETSAALPRRHRRGRVLLLERPTPGLRQAMEGVFDTVVAPPVTLLPKDELAEVLSAPMAERLDLCLGGLVDRESGLVVLYRGDLSALPIPLASFRPSGDGIEPDAERFAVTDFGRTLRFGAYEAAFDAVLYEFDRDYRRRIQAKRHEEERTFGAALRRLRKQRGVLRSDFHGIDEKTIGRIERGEVDRPHAKTLKILADRLGVEPDDIGEY